MNSNIRIQSILERYPEVENVFSMYEVDLTDESSNLTIEQICESYGLDIEDILMDIEELIQDSRQAEWLANGSEDDQWTDHFTEETNINSKNDSNVDDDYDDNSDEFYDSDDY